MPGHPVRELATHAHHTRDLALPWASAGTPARRSARRRCQIADPPVGGVPGQSRACLVARAEPGRERLQPDRQCSRPTSSNGSRLHRSCCCTEATPGAHAGGVLRADRQPARSQVGQRPRCARQRPTALVTAAILASLRASVSRGTGRPRAASLAWPHHAPRNTHTHHPHADSLVSTSARGAHVHDPVRHGGVRTEPDRAAAVGTELEHRPRRGLRRRRLDLRPRRERVPGRHRVQVRAGTGPLDAPAPNLFLAPADLAGRARLRAGGIALPADRRAGHRDAAWCRSGSSPATSTPTTCTT